MQQHPRPLATDQPQRCLDQWNRKSLSPPTGSRTDPRPERDQPLGVDAIKLFYRRNLKLLVMFIPGCNFQDRLMFASMVGDYLSEALFRSFPLG